MSARRWAKTDATQQRILDAATDVFAAHGFTAATMADIVEQSGASIGSIYHHFGGKKELFLAIFDRLAAEIEHRIDAATGEADEADRQRTFEVTVRAYLEAMWANRHAAMVLVFRRHTGRVRPDSPRQHADRLRRWMSVLELDTSPRGQLLNRILIAVMVEASAMVIAMRHRRRRASRSPTRPSSGSAA